MLEITPEELGKLITPPGRAAAAKVPRAPAQRPVLFFGTSFRESPQVSEQARLIRSVFEERFEITGGWDVSTGRQLAKIRTAIARADATIAEATYLLPNVMIEIGIAFGLAHRTRKQTFLLFNVDAPSTAIADLPEYVRSLDITSYSFDARRLREARDKIYEKVQVEPEPEELMSVNIRGSTLRPRPDNEGIYMYYPHERKIWSSLIDELRDEIERAGLRLYTWVGAPSGSTQLEEVVYNVRRSSPKLSVSCFVDTSNDTSVNLVGAFALGVATALGRGVERLVEAEKDHPTDISLWTEPIFKWHTREELISHIIDASRRKKTGPRRKR